MQTATSETESKSLFLSIRVHHYTLRAPCPKGQGMIVTDWALAATALACFTASEIASLASIDFFFTRFASISAAPSRPHPPQHDEKQDLVVIFGSITDKIRGSAIWCVSQKQVGPPGQGPGSKASPFRENTDTQFVKL